MTHATVSEPKFSIGSVTLLTPEAAAIAVSRLNAEELSIEGGWRYETASFAAVKVFDENDNFLGWL